MRVSQTSGGDRLQAGAVGRPAIEHGEGDVRWIFGEDACTERPGFVFGAIFDADLGAAGRKIAQGAQAPLADNFFGGFGNWSEYAADAAGFIADRAVGKCEIALLGIVMALEKEEEVFSTNGFGAGKNAVEHRPDGVPNFRPGLTAGDPKGSRVLGAENFGILVVVEHDEFRSPPEKNRETAVEASADRSAKALRPIFGRTERGCGPIMGTHLFAHEATSAHPERG